jgi:hypothetical protein
LIIVSEACTIYILLAQALANVALLVIIITDTIIEQHTLKNVNNYLDTYVYCYLETSGGQSTYLYLNVAHLFNKSVN